MDAKVVFHKKLDRQIGPIIRNTYRNIATWKRNSPKISSWTYNEFLVDRYLVMSVIRQGIPYSLFDTIRSYSPFTENDWASYLNISTKTLHRFEAEDKNLKPILSEKIIELSEVILSGVDTFGSLEKFNSWLDTPNFALGKIKPFELLRDSYGKDLLMAELNRINHGILG